MQFSDLATRIVGTAFEALCFHVCSTSCMVSTHGDGVDGGLAGGSEGSCGGSSGGVGAHACGAEGGAGGEAGEAAIGEADS